MPLIGPSGARAVNARVAPHCSVSTFLTAVAEGSQGCAPEFGPILVSGGVPPLTLSQICRGAAPVDLAGRGDRYPRVARLGERVGRMDHEAPGPMFSRR